MCQFFRPYKSKLKKPKQILDYKKMFNRNPFDRNSFESLIEAMSEYHVQISNTVYKDNIEYHNWLIERIRSGEIERSEAMSIHFGLCNQYIDKIKNKVSTYECQNCKRWYIDSIENADIKECVDCRH